jgi:hypothetical protein
VVRPRAKKIFLPIATRVLGMFCQNSERSLPFCVLCNCWPDHISDRSSSAPAPQGCKVSTTRTPFAPAPSSALWSKLFRLWPGAAQAERTLNLSQTWRETEYSIPIASPPSVVVIPSSFTLQPDFPSRQAMQKVDRANFVLRKVDAYEDSPQLRCLLFARP